MLDYILANTIHERGGFMYGIYMFKCLIALMMNKRHLYYYYFHDIHYYDYDNNYLYYHHPYSPYYLEYLFHYISPIIIIVYIYHYH